MKRLLWSAVLAAILGTTIWAQGTKYMGGVWGKGVDGVNNGVAYKTEVPNMVGPYGQPVEMKMPYAARPPQGEDMARAMMAQSVPLDLAVHLQKGGGSGLSQAQYCGPGGCAHPSSGQGGLPPGISPPSFPTPPGGLGGMGGPGMGMGGPGMGMGGPGMGMGGPGMGMGGPGMGMGGPGMGGPGMGRPVSMNPGGAMFPQQGLNPGAQFAAGPLGGPGAVAAVGAMTGGPGGGAPFQAARTQIRFVGPTGMRISWYAPGPNGQGFTSEYLEAPGRYNFVQAAIYRLKLTNLPNRTNVTALYPTLEIVPASNKTATFLAHASVPISFTEEDIEQVVAGNFLVKVIYLPDPQFQELAATGPDEVVSTRLEPGVDPIAEALRRGSIMAIIRVGNSDLEAPNTPAMDAPPPGYNGPRPGAMPPGAMPPGAMPPGAMPPGAMPQGAPSMSTGAPIGLPGLPTRPQQPLTMSNNAGPSLVPNVPAFQGPRSNPYLAPSPIPGLPASVQGSGPPPVTPPTRGPVTPVSGTQR